MIYKGIINLIYYISSYGRKMKITYTHNYNVWILSIIWTKEVVISCKWKGSRTEQNRIEE
jgi:hypothetical protein